MRIESARKSDARGFHLGESVTGRTLDELAERIGEAKLVAPVHPSMKPYTHVVVLGRREAYVVKEER